MPDFVPFSVYLGCDRRRCNVNGHTTKHAPFRGHPVPVVGTGRTRKQQIAMLYRCKHCGQTVERDSEKAWIPSYCEKTGRNVRLVMVPGNHTVLKNRLRKYYKSATPEQVVKELESIGAEFIEL